MEWSKIKEATEAIKNIGLLIFYALIIGIFVFYILPVLPEMKLNEAAVGGFKWTRTIKSAQKTIDKSQKETNADPSDSSVKSGKLYTAAKIVDTTINLNTQNWVWIGQITNGKLTNSHFKIKKIPSIGDLITAKDGVFKRKDLPVELKNDVWRLGDIRGIVQTNESVKVRAIQEISGHNFWALVE